MISPGSCHSSGPSPVHSRRVSLLIIKPTASEHPGVFAIHQSWRILSYKYNFSSQCNYINAVEKCLHLRENKHSRSSDCRYVYSRNYSSRCVFACDTQTHRGVQAQQSIAPLCFLSQNLSNDQSGIMIQSTQQDLWGVTIAQIFHQEAQSMRLLAERIDRVLFEHPLPPPHTHVHGSWTWWLHRGGNERWSAHSLPTVFFFLIHADDLQWVPPISLSLSVNSHHCSLTESYSPHTYHTHS